jgi:hypothetical protein
VPNVKTPNSERGFLKKYQNIFTLPNTLSISCCDEGGGMQIWRFKKVVLSRAKVQYMINPEKMGKNQGIIK